MTLYANHRGFSRPPETAGSATHKPRVAGTLRLPGEGPAPSPNLGGLAELGRLALPQDPA